MSVSKITPFLWFDSQAEDAAKYYVSIFKNSKILHTSPYTEVGAENHGREPGSIMIVEFELDGQYFTALNGGPIVNFNMAVSFYIHCEDQAEVDYFWERLGADGDPSKQACGTYYGNISTVHSLFSLHIKFLRCRVPSLEPFCSLTMRNRLASR
jgi:predicted 3-demethylubiquinone-9 3-methyltransferase (glyoxalase superfamily)